MRKLLLLVTIHEFLKPVQSVNGVLWDKNIGHFVPIFSVPAFATVNQKLLNQSRCRETHKFQGKIVTVAYYEEMNIIQSQENGTRITGVIGEIWNILSEFLNFTLKPILSEDHTLGYWKSEGSYSTGLLKVIQRNEVDVIPRMEAHSKRINATQFSIPLWQTSYRLYIRREVKHLRTWMLKLFSRRVWYAILMTYLLLTMCSYLSHMVHAKFRNNKSKADLRDHFFNNFGMICGQSTLPHSVSKSSKIVELWLGLFSCLIRTAFGALLIRYMTQTVSTPPFYDMTTLVDDSSYKVFTLKGSLPHMLFQLNKIPAFMKAAEKDRHVVAETREEMYKTTCTSNKPYAIFQSEDIKKARGLYICPLNPVGISLFDSWIVSGISWNFRYKRSIDIGILRLYEVGFINLLKHRWIETKNAEDVENKSEPIVMEQVHLIILIFTTGLCVSFVVLLLENLVFYWNNCHKGLRE